MTTAGARWSCCAVVAGALAGCSSSPPGEGGGSPVSQEERAALDLAADLDATFVLRASSGSVEGLRAAIPELFPEWTTLAQAGDGARAEMLGAFSPAAPWTSDLALAIYAEALEDGLRADESAALRTFVAGGLAGDLDVSLHFATHALRRAQGASGGAESGWYSGFQIGAAAAGDPPLAAAGEIAQALDAPKRCRRRWLLADADGKPITYVDPRDGKTRTAAIEGDEVGDPTVPPSLAEHWRAEVKDGGGTYVGDDPKFQGAPSRQFNCGGYAFRDVNGGNAWNLDPSQAHAVMVAAGLMEEVADADAKAGDKVFFFGTEGGDVPKHVAEVKSPGGTFSSIVVRNADQASGLWEAKLSATYFTGNLLGTTKPHYGAHKIYRYKNGAAPKAIPDPAAATNAAYCGGHAPTGEGTLDLGIDVPGDVLSFRPNQLIAASGPSTCFADGGTFACDVLSVLASEQSADGGVGEVLQIACFREALGAAGSYALGAATDWIGQGGTVPCWLSFTTPDLTDADGLSASFFTDSGSIAFTALAPTPGGRITGDIDAHVAWQKVTGTDGQGNTTYETVSGTIKGSFDLPVH